MRSVSYRLADIIKARIPLGFVGENEHTVVQFDAKQAFDQYPTATPSLTVKNPSGEKYPAVVVRDGDMVIWTISDSDLIVPGHGEFQLQFKEGDTVMRSYVGETRIERSIMPTGDVPTPVQNWIDAAEDVLEEVEEAIPAGGTTGQVLAKKSDADRDTEWVDQTGGGGGTTNYNALSNKPQIGGVTLSGNKTLHELGAAAEADIPDVSGFYTKPAGGIPASDIADGVIPDVSGFYTKPQTGIPASDLAAGVIPTVHNVPAGGSTNQVLAKNSGTDYDMKWVNQSGGGGGAEIDDTAGEGDTDVVWSADKTWTETEALKEAIGNVPSGSTVEEQISDLKSAIDELDDSVFVYAPLEASATVSGWTLTGSGGSRSYSGNSLVKYQVTAGEKLYLKLAKDWSVSSDSQGVYQWQNNSSVPSGTNQYLVGNPVTDAVDGVVTVPTGATYLIVAQKSDNSTNQVNTTSNAWSSEIEELKNEFETVEAKTPSATSSNWTLTGSGGSRSYTGNNLVKYQVTAGEKLYLKLAKDWSVSSDSQGVYQWQNSASVPSSNDNQYLIGTPVTNETDGIVTVPTGATYLIVAQKSTNTTNVVQKVSFAWDSEIARLDGDISKTKKDVFTFSLNDNFKFCNVSAHAGASNDVYAINSMPGFKNAISHGDRMVECDVRITSDGVPVLFHDETLKSSNIADYTGDPIYVGALTYEQTQAYNLPKSSGKIPRLLDALLLCKKHGVILEIDLAGKTWKSDASTTIMTQAQALQAVLDVVDGCGMRKNVFLTIEYSGSTSQVSALIPITTDIAIGVSNRTSASSISAISSVISTFPLVICSIGENYTDSDLMTAIKNAGENCKAKAFTLNTSADIDAAINAGVAYCLSNEITQDTYDEYTLT